MLNSTTQPRKDVEVMARFIESTNAEGKRSYINAEHIISVDETGENRCLIITDGPPGKDSMVPLYCTVDASYDEVVALIKKGGEG